VDVDNGNGTELPVREVTVNQVVAWNIARWRRALGLTQAQLGPKIGMSGAVLSEAERSWDGKRTREFDAQLLTVITLALGVPLAALFLPPEDDGATIRYVIRDGAGRPYPMGDYMALAVMPDNDDQTPVMTDYRDRLNAAAARYLDPAWMTDVARWLKGTGTPAGRAELAARLEDRERALRESAADLATLAAAIRAGEGDSK